jgi:hypothetical protein
MRYALLIAAVILAGAQVAAQSGGVAQGTPLAVDQVSPASVEDIRRRVGQQRAVDLAEKAIAELQTTLVGRLKAELGKGGPPAAVAVCRDEAQQLTASIGATHGLEMGRTSDRVRNPANTPRSWAATYVASWAGARAADAQPAVFELSGGRVGVLRPIGTMDLCVMCHGPREAVQATIGDVLKTSYPDDRAVGFAPGDLRGWFWVETEAK